MFKILTQEKIWYLSKECSYGNFCFYMGLNLRLRSWCSNVSQVMPRLDEVGEMHGR
jgi:hypothetical protein